MIHKECNAAVLFDLTFNYVIRSPSITYNPKGISHGMLQIDDSGNKSQAKLVCVECGDSFNTKEEFENEIIVECDNCGRKFPPSEIHITDFIPKLCKDCIKEAKSGKISSYKENRLLSLYSGVFAEREFPTLLTLLLKKG